jgi:hypothetical protein
MSWEAIGGILGAAAFTYTAIRVPAIERLKGDLEKEQARFTATYQRQLDVVAELYQKLVLVEADAVEMMKPMRMADEESEEETRQRLVLEFHDLWTFFIKHRLFLPKDLAADVDSLIQRMRKTSQEFVWMRTDEFRGDESSWRDWGTLWAEIRDEIPIVRGEIEEEFRTLLGMA